MTKTIIDDKKNAIASGMPASHLPYLVFMPDHEHICLVIQMHVLFFTGAPLIGRFVPQCKDDGSFKEVQCYPSTGYCWCVDVTGVELAKSRVRGQPDCSKGK